ncbi:MAG: hypothetical protein HKM93_07805 [Desulfobacteraceae bacterium]|nr:hypothetical protein [Desulfobacteraceae bacterium]
MTPYQREQWDTLSLVENYISRQTSSERSELSTAIEKYLDYRHRLDIFLSLHFNEICTRECFQNNLSACCSKDGIITFFGDVVVNVLASDETHLNTMFNLLTRPHTSPKCLYLTTSGCAWRIRPSVCALFLCDRAKDAVFSLNPDRKVEWDELKREEKDYKWPDKPVVFDYLETVFIEAGIRSPLMYLHNSPGLLRVKKRAGIL